MSPSNALSSPRAVVKQPQLVLAKAGSAAALYFVLTGFSAAPRRALDFTKAFSTAPRHVMEEALTT